MKRAKLLDSSILNKLWQRRSILKSKMFMRHSKRNYTGSNRTPYNIRIWGNSKHDFKNDGCCTFFRTKIVQPSSKCKSDKVGNTIKCDLSNARCDFILHNLNLWSDYHAYADACVLRCIRNLVWKKLPYTTLRKCSMKPPSDYNYCIFLHFWPVTIACALTLLTNFPTNYH